jgi:hypothetical protein
VLGQFPIDTRNNIVLQPQQLGMFTSPGRQPFPLRTRDGYAIPYREFARAVRQASKE